jgi:hypothetical protein
MTKHAGGRPLKFKDVKELQEKIVAYFADCDPHPEQRVYFKFYEMEEGYRNAKGELKTHMITDRTRPPEEIEEWRVSDQKPYSVTGLANFLETSRETLINYEKRDEFFDTIKRAKSKIEHYWELELLGSHPTGPIFNLKNNYGWKDQSQVDNTHRIEKPILGGISKQDVPTDDSN